MKPFFNLLAETVCKVHHLFSFLVGYHTGMIITADISFLSKLIEQSYQAGISSDGISKRLNNPVMMSLSLCTIV